MKRVKAFLLALVMIISSVCISFGNEAVFAADGITLKLHYNRPDGEYSDWMVWFWAEGQAGADYQFAEENGEQVATYSVPAGTLNIGYIVKTASWGKDVDKDQFIDISEVFSGTLDYYVESGVEGGTLVYGDDVVTGTRMKSAIYDGDVTLEVEMTGVIEADDLSSVFTLQSKDGEDITISSVETTEEENIYKVTLAGGLDDKKTYYIAYQGVEVKVSIPNPYSTDKFEATYTYDGDDLGATYTADATTFKVWAPTADAAKVKLYATGSDAEEGAKELGTHAMTAAENGVWEVTVEEDLKDVYYTYVVTLEGSEVEACDPYAKATGVNGDRAMVIDLDSTDPEGWEEDKNPHAGENITDAIIYEMHVRDASIDASSGVDEDIRGTFLGLVQTGTKTEGGVSTGLDHMVDLGITHLHILPMYDYSSVDETGNGSSYNWGYDPKNYNVPEGSYSTNPYDGDVRVAEAKEMVQTLHENGISVVMDVVYNHVSDAGNFCFNKIVPGYFSRINEDGSYSNGSGCGNDTASERSMVSKYIVDSVKYWADEYHIDGFRFDLVGLIDTVTINAVIEEVHKTHPDVIFYGEGWTMSTDVTKDGYYMSTQVNSEMTPEFAYFNDAIRDGLKGSVFDYEDPGFVSGKDGLESVISAAFLGDSAWCSSPSQTVNYAACHDNHTLFDRLQMSTDDETTREELIKMNNLAAAIYMTSQGVPFMLGGEELLRSKEMEDGTFDHNSYASGDAINSMKWSELEKEDVSEVYDYYKGLIAFRKAHDVLRLTTAEEVADSVSTLTGLDANVLGFSAESDTEDIYLYFNATEEAVDVKLPAGEWDVYVSGNKAGTDVLSTVTDGKATVDAISTLILVQEKKDDYTGLKKVDNVWYMFEDGEVTGDYTGLVFYNDNWFYVNNSKVDFSYTGLVKYNNNWFYVKSGVLDWDYTGLCKRNGNWFYVNNGCVNFGYTGLVKHAGSWFYVKSGVLDWSYTGLVKNAGNWFYVKGGVLDWNYTGLAKNDGYWFYVNKGILNWNYTGLVKHAGSWFYVNKGVLNWNYTGLVKHAGSWFYVKGGILNWNYTGLVKHAGSWFYVKGGVLDWSYTGLAKNDGHWFYVEKGVLNWKYTGYTTYNGSKWYVKSGVMVQ